MDVDEIVVRVALAVTFTRKILLEHRDKRIGLARRPRRIDEVGDFQAFIIARLVESLLDQFPELERQIDYSMSSPELRARINRALGSRPDHFTQLKELLPRIRNFDYPPIPKGLKPHKNDLIEFLRFASEL